MARWFHGSAERPPNHSSGVGMDNPYVAYMAKLVFNTDKETYDIMYGEEVKLSLTAQEWFDFSMSVDGAEDKAIQYYEAKGETEV